MDRLCGLPGFPVWHQLAPPRTLAEFREGWAAEAEVDAKRARLDVDLSLITPDDPELGFADLSPITPDDTVQERLNYSSGHSTFSRLT